MLKIEAILGMYGLTALQKNKALTFGEEIFNVWVVEGLTKKELVKKFSKKEITQIYYEAI